MEDDNRTPPTTESSESTVGAVAGAGQGVEEVSSECSQQQQVRAKGSEGEESSPSPEDSERRKQQEAGIEEDKSGTSTSRSTGKGTGGSSSKSGGADADVDTDRQSSVASSMDLVEARDSAMDALEIDKQKDINTIAVIEQYLEQVANESDDLRNFSKEVLAKFNLGVECELEMVGYMPRDYEGPPESSLFPHRLKAVEDYLKTAYRSFALQLGVSGSQEQEVDEATTGLSAGTREGTTEMKKRKIDSDVSTEAPKVKKLAVVLDVQKSAETAMECEEGFETTSMVHKELGDAPPTATVSEKPKIGTEGDDVQVSPVETSSSTAEEDVEGATAGSSYLPLPTKEVRKACEIARTSRKVIAQQRAALHHMSATADAYLDKIRLACDFLLTSAKSVQCMVAQALNSHALCPLLLKVSETALDEENFQTVKQAMSLATQFAGLAIEAAEAAIQYHKSAVSYLMDAQGSVPLVQVQGRLGEEVLWQVIRAAKEIEKLAWQGPAVSAEELAEKRRVVEEMASILSPALKRVKDANVFTKDVVAKFDRALLHKAMEVSVKGANGYTLSVIHYARRVLEMLSESTAGTRGAESAQDEAAGGPVPQEEYAAQGGTAFSDVSEKGGGGGANV